MHMVALEVDAGHVGDDAFAADAVAKAQHAIVRIERQQMREYARRIGGQKARQRAPEFDSSPSKKPFFEKSR